MKSKKKNYIELWKESLTIDDQQFHHCQLNEQSPLSFTHYTQKGSRYMTLETKALAWDRHENGAGLNRLLYILRTDGS